MPTGSKKDQSKSSKQKQVSEGGHTYPPPHLVVKVAGTSDKSDRIRILMVVHRPTGSQPTHNFPDPVTLSQIHIPAHENFLHLKIPVDSESDVCLGQPDSSVKRNSIYAEFWTTKCSAAPMLNGYRILEVEPNHVDTNTPNQVYTRFVPKRHLQSASLSITTLPTALRGKV